MQGDYRRSLLQENHAQDRKCERDDKTGHKTANCLKRFSNSCTVLRSMTAGRGSYEYEFVRYEQAPSDVQEKEIANRQAEE